MTASEARPPIQGFTMVELLVVIGVIMVLVGLLLPIAGRAMDRTRSASDLVTIRSNAAIVMQSAADHEGIYPRADSRRCSASVNWTRPLLESGHLSSLVDADPRAFPRFGEITFVLSQSLVADLAEFQWGTTRPCSDSPSADSPSIASVFHRPRG